MINKPTEEQKVIIRQNMHNYYTPDGDPHNELAIALGVPRNEAKQLFYIFLWSEDGLMNRNFRQDFYRVKFLTDAVGVTGEERKSLHEASYVFADKREEMRQAKRNGTS